MLSGFNWPDSMPSGMEELKNYQAVTASDRETFDLAMQRLAGYLQSPRRNRILVRKVMVIIFAFFALLASSFAVLRLTARPTCTQVSSFYTNNAIIVHEAYRCESEIKSSWQSFLRAYSAARSEDRRSLLCDDLLMDVQRWEQNASILRKTIPTPPELSGMETIMLATHGVLTIVLPHMPEYTALFCDETDSMCAVIKQSIVARDINTTVESIMEMHFGSFEHSANAFYYGYLSELSHFPASSKEIHNAVYTQWNLFPSISDGLPAAEYDKMQQCEMDKSDKIVQEYAIYAKKQDDDIEQLSNRLDSLEELSDKVDVIMSITAEQVTDEQMIQARKEKVLMKGEIVKQKRAQLAEVEKQLEDVYQELLKNCTLLESDSENYQWGKICRMAKMLQTTVNNQRMNPNTIISPERVLQDLTERLVEFTRLHPESKPYVQSLNAYYGLVAEDKCALGGQVIIGFLKDGQQTMENVHPLYRVGDIIVSRNERSVTDYQSMTDAAALTPVVEGSTAARGTVAYYRFDGEKLTLHKDSVPAESSVLVGYRNVGE